MARNILSPGQEAGIASALQPWFTGAEQEALISASDKAAKAAYDEAFDNTTVQVDALANDLASTEAGKGAELIGFLQEGVGAEERTLLDKAREILSVTDFGAVGDGVADDTAAFAAGIAKAASDNAELRIPKGHYKITSGSNSYGLQIDAPIRLVGDGPGLTLITYVANAVDKPGILVTSDGVHISGLTIDGSANSTAAGTGGAANCANIKLADVNNCSVRNVETVGGHYGVWLNSSKTGTDYTVNKNNTIESCYARNCASSGFHTIRGSFTKIHNNHAEGCGTDGFKFGGGTYRSSITGNTSTGNARDGFDLYDGFIGSVLADNVASANLLQGYEIKGTFDGSWDANDYVVRDSIIANNVAVGNLGENGGFSILSVRAMSFIGNVASDNTQHGFSLGDNVQGCTFTGCVASRNGRHGFTLGSTISRVTFVGCYAINNSWVDGTTQNGTYNGFNVSSGCTAQFIGCSSINGPTAGIQGGQGYGFFFATGATNSTINGCYTIGNTVSGFGGDSGWDTSNNFFTGVLNSGATFGLKASGTSLAVLGADADLALSRNGANATVSAERQSGAKVFISAQSTASQVGTMTNHPVSLVTNGTSRWSLAAAGHFSPATNNTYDLGTSSTGVKDAYIAGRVLLGTQQIIKCTGTPEGVVTAPVGSMALRTDGGANTTLYIKESGTGNTGWVAK